MRGFSKKWWVWFGALIVLRRLMSYWEKYGDLEFFVSLFLGFVAAIAVLITVWNWAKKKWITDPAEAKAFKREITSFYGEIPRTFPDINNPDAVTEFITKGNNTLIRFKDEKEIFVEQRKNKDFKRLTVAMIRFESLIKACEHEIGTRQSRRPGKSRAAQLEKLIAIIPSDIDI